MIRTLPLPEVSERKTGPSKVHWGVARAHLSPTLTFRDFSLFVARMWASIVNAQKNKQICLEKKGATKRSLRQKRLIAWGCSSLVCDVGKLAQCTDISVRY